MKNKYTILILLLCVIIAGVVGGLKYFSNVMEQRINPLEEKISELSSQINNPKIEDKQIANILPVSEEQNVAEPNKEDLKNVSIIYDNSVCEKPLKLIIDAYKLCKAVKNGQFYNELAVLKSVVEDDNILKVKLNILTQYSDQGIYTLEYLQNTFKMLAKQMLENIEGRSVEDELEKPNKILMFLQKMVVVQKVTEINKLEYVTKVLDQVLLAVSVGNLEEAVKLLKQLPDNYLVNISEWIENAERFLIVNDTVDEIYTHIMSKY
ncbi:MAG: hypothetical protein AB8U25_05550 [Rickettsiales endosymbiont of Dermacentor nuttalli]